MNNYNHEHEKLSQAALDAYWKTVEDPYYYSCKYSWSSSLATSECGEFIETTNLGLIDSQFNEWGPIKGRTQKE